MPVNHEKLRKSFIAWVERDMAQRASEAKGDELDASLDAADRGLVAGLMIATVTNSPTPGVVRLTSTFGFGPEVESNWVEFGADDTGVFCQFEAIYIDHLCLLQFRQKGDDWEM